MQGEKEYLTRSQFASKQGWSPSYITKLGQQGKLVLSADEKFVDVNATLINLKNSQDPGKESIRQHHQSLRIEKNVGEHIRPDAQISKEPSGASDPKYWDIKARREGALADLAELELSKKRGELVDRQRVEAMAFTAGRMLRDAVLGLPTQLAPEFASMTDSFAIETKLRDALRQVFSDAMKMTADDLLRISDQAH